MKQLAEGSCCRLAAAWQANCIQLGVWSCAQKRVTRVAWRFEALGCWLSTTQSDE
jgi:hypothetical protein